MALLEKLLEKVLVQYKSLNNKTVQKKPSEKKKVSKKPLSIDKSKHTQ